MVVEEKLEKIEKEIQSIKMLITFRSDLLAEKKPVSLRGICDILVSDEELEKYIESAKKSVFGGTRVLRD
ncbi:hypothetical protein [Archaeoglobus neptunius]|uniref:hypothetical protein n=1 Tax=Archaeoglobus neptunius TaxID=2798580 RepID=UPI0019264175|nr:hypothetical protein [Archaeoglobus neptunius]